MNFIKTQVVITAIPFLLFIAGCSSPLVYTNVWQKKPVTIDGKATEWKIPLDYFDDKTKLNFTITNDKTNLYFCIRATEDETQKGIIYNGLQIWIDTTGGKKSQVGIQFPVMERSASVKSSGRHEKQSYEESPDESPDAAIARLKAHYTGTSKQMQLTGFANAVNGLVQVPNMYGINSCLNWDTNNIMIYEVCIPLKTFYRPVLSLSDTNKVFGVSFIVTVASLHRSMGGGGDMGGPGGMGGGMTGMDGSMQGGGKHGGSESSLSTEKLTAHIKFRLAMGASTQ